MSTVTPHTSLPRKPLGRTFIVAVFLLALFAAVQVLAVFGHLIPVMRKQLTAYSLQSQQAPTPAPEAIRQPTAPSSAQAHLDQTAEIRQRTELLVAEAAKNIRIGQYDPALKMLEEAEALVPGDPKILQLKALVLERTDRLEEAAIALDTALTYPGLPQADRMAMEKKLDQLSSALGTSVERQPGATAAMDAAPIEENGVPIGSNLGIVDIRISDTKVGTKTLQVAVKSRENADINVKDVKIVVYFYEDNAEGDVTLTEAPVPSQWLSPPIDWAANEPELLRMQYTMPAEDSGKKYHGYVLGIYYNNELQDFRSEPSKLAKDFPLPLFLKSAE